MNACFICHKPSSSEHGQLKACSHCGFRYHRQCHYPEIDRVYLTNMTLRWYCGPCNNKGLRSATPPIETVLFTSGEEISRKRRRVGSAEGSNDQLQENKSGGKQSAQANSGAEHHGQDRQEHRQHERGDERQERDGPLYQGRVQNAPAVAEQTNRQQIVVREQERQSHIEAETQDMVEQLKKCEEIYRRNSDDRSDEKRRLEGAIEKRDQTIEELKQTVQQQDQVIEERDQTIEELKKTVQQRDQVIEERDKIVGERENLVLSLKSTSIRREKECKELQKEEKKLRQSCKDLRDKLSKAKQFQKEDDEKVEEEHARVRKVLERLQERKKRQINVFDFDESEF